MSRPLRLDAPGLAYHVMARGNARMTLFTDDTEYQYFLKLWSRVVTSEGLACWTYCLMPNHVHLVVQPSRGNLSRAMARLNGAYAQWFNRRHRRVGHVTQGRFKAQVVQHHRYLLAVCRYVLLNPVRAGLTDDAMDWPWSSCAATLGLAVAPACLDVRLLLEATGPAPVSVQRARVARLLQRPDTLGVGAAVREDHRVIGEPGFVECFREEAEAAVGDVSRRERRLARPPLESLLLSGIGGTLATRVQHAATQGYSVAAIAGALGLGQVSVRRMLARAADLTPPPSPRRSDPRTDVPQV